MLFSNGVLLCFLCVIHTSFAASQPTFVLIVTHKEVEVEHFCVVDLISPRDLPVSVIPKRLNLISRDKVPATMHFTLADLPLLLATPAEEDRSDTSSYIVLVISSASENQKIRSILQPLDFEYAYLKLKSPDFEKLSELSKRMLVDSILVQPDGQTDTQTSYSLYPVLLVNACAIASILLGCATAYASREKLLAQVRAAKNPFTQSKCTAVLALGLLIALACGCLLIYYFFFDIAVYMAIAFYFIVGALAVADLFATWIMLRFVATQKAIHFALKLGRLRKDMAISITQLCMLPVGFTIMSVWLVFRNDPRIGWPMQSVIGTLLIARILSSALPLSSLKAITVVFTALVLYDVFFVFITPYFVSVKSALQTTAETLHLSRSARSTSESVSYMEAIATGSAGKSGEALPYSFRFQLKFPVGEFRCGSNISHALLGYGDAVFPGFLCTYLIFFDSVWRIPFRRNFLASIVGFILGIGVTQLVLNFMSRAQPALLYLCPITLLLTVCVAAVFGGLDELRLLWNGALPPLFVEEQTNTDVTSCDLHKDGPLLDDLMDGQSPSVYTSTTYGDYVNADSHSIPTL